MDREEKRGVFLEGIPSFCSPKSVNKTLCFDGIKEQFKFCIELFLIVLENNSNFDLNNFYSNFHKDCIVEKYKDNRVVLGSYYPFLNQIVLYNNQFMTFIFHELFHMATRDKRMGRLCVGFKYLNSSSDKSKQYIGDALNEGYTELLAKRYFSDFGHVSSKNYEVLYMLASLIEFLVGKDFMENCYSKADLYSLVIHLTKFGTAEEIITIFKKMDRLLIEMKILVKEKRLLYRKRYKTYTEIMVLIAKLYARAMATCNNDSLDYYKKFGEVITKDIKYYEISGEDKKRIFDVMSEEYFKMKNDMVITDHKALNFVRKQTEKL